MDEDRLKHRIYALDRWKAELGQAINDYREWLNQSGLATPEKELRIHERLEMLHSDRLTIAFVAEFSRGKTELINSIFFADYKRRLLPSTVGRTTMCPTELFWDRIEEQSYIKLLPIETRSQDTSIAEFKNQENAWTCFKLDMDSPDQMAETLKEVIRTKKVPVEEAKRLGLYDEDPANGGGEASDGQVEIPVWRHAMVSFPHPLLKQGLVILDTPGLNALGTEPELTLNMLPNAQAVVFVLAADTGVTRSDLDMWQYYIKGSLDVTQKGVIATLNKIDAMWDEMMDEDEIASAIEAQRRGTAAMLGLDHENVLTVSAQKALVAKAKQDHELLNRSQILKLESLLADEIVPAKQKIVRDQMVHEISGMIEENKSLLGSRLAKINEQLKSLKGLSGKNADVLKHLTQKTREQQVAYNKNMKMLQSSRRTLSQQASAIMNELSLAAFDYLVTKTRRDMMESWTTLGLKSGMRTFFQGVGETIEVVARQAAQTHELIESIYKKFHEEHGLPEMEFPRFDVQKYREEIKKLASQEEEFRSSPVTTMTEQSFVVKKFFISLVSHAREVYFRAHQDAEIWLKEIMAPLVSQINMHKQLLEQHLDTLCKITETKESLTQKVKDLELQGETVRNHVSNLQSISQRLHATLDEPDTAPKYGDGTRAAAMEAKV